MKLKNIISFFQKSPQVPRGKQRFMDHPLAYHMSVGRLLSQTMLRGDATNKDFGINYQMSRPRSVLKRPRL